MFDTLHCLHEPNHNGRDFIVGDLHGNLFLFEKFLTLINFDPQNDRMFSCGDLVDRGKNSFECLNKLDESWFYTVPGNHEQMLWYYVNKPQDSYASAFIYNGGSWIFKHDSDEDMNQLSNLCETISKLPRMRTVKKKDGTQVHILHAELNAGWKDTPVTDADIEDESILKKMLTLQSLDGEYSFWGRGVFGEMYDEKLIMVL